MGVREPIDPPGPGVVLDPIGHDIGHARIGRPGDEERGRCLVRREGIHMGSRSDGIDDCPGVVRRAPRRRGLRVAGLVRRRRVEFVGPVARGGEGEAARIGDDLRGIEGPRGQTSSAVPEGHRLDAGPVPVVVGVGDAERERVLVRGEGKGRGGRRRDVDHAEILGVARGHVDGTGVAPERSPRIGNRDAGDIVVDLGRRLLVHAIRDEEPLRQAARRREVPCGEAVVVHVDVRRPEVGAVVRPEGRDRQEVSHRQVRRELDRELRGREGRVDRRGLRVVADAEVQVADRGQGHVRQGEPRLRRRVPDRDCADAVALRAAGAGPRSAFGDRLNRIGM